MSLQVWLPLNGDLRSQGIKNVSITNNGATINNNGKIGKCYQFGASASQYIDIAKEAMTSCTAEASVCFWFKILTWNTSYATYFQAGPAGISWQHYTFGLLRNASNSTCCFTISNGTTASNASYLTPAFDLNKWYHISLIYKTGHCLIYINGQLYQDYTTSIVPNFANITRITLGMGNNRTGYQTNCLMNDLRIYNNALSTRQIKEISKGLILHYPLNRNGWKVASNLLLNGFGELGTTNWNTSSGVYTDDLPTEDNSIKARFYNLTSLDYIPVYRNHTYKYSCYIKALSTSGTVYPSLLPYDRDKNMISTQHTKEGFNLNTMTTLTQQLKSGDTKIYVENLSTWNSNSGNYYNYAAIFGYKDSLGNTYPDGVYTRTVPAFGTGTNAKTNLDKTNNIITLNKAYSGATIPIGTHICQSAAGSTYFYPLGGIANSTIQNWTYKEKTFSSEHPRLVAAKYVKVYTYTGSTQAGITLEDLTINDDIEYDISGYQNNGTRTGTFKYTSNTPKYSVSTVYTGSNYIYLNSPPTEIYTIAVWVKWDTIPSGQSVILVDNGSKIGLGLMSTGILCSTSGAGNSYIFSKANLVANTWYHFVVVKTGTTTRKLYINGIEQTATSNTSTWTYSVNQLQLGKRSTTSDGFVGQLSDFRAYATAFSAEDVLSLYNNGAYIDQLNEIHGKVR